MKLNPITQELFTDEGELIKRLHCPHNLRWDEMITDEGRAKNNICTNCDHEIIDPSGYSDSKLLELVRWKEKCCIALDLHRGDVKVIIQ